jgi:hypothetical protein
LSDCSHISWEQSHLCLTAPNYNGRSLTIVGFSHPNVGICNCVLGEVVFLAMTDSALRLHFYLLLPKYLGAVTHLSDCSQISWEQSFLYLTAPNKIGSSLKIFIFLQPKVGICHCVLGEVRFLAMTDSALRIQFYLLLPISLGAVRFLPDCSHIIWEQSGFGRNPPKII